MFDKTEVLCESAKAVELALHDIRNDDLTCFEVPLGEPSGDHDILPTDGKSKSQ